MPFFRMTDASRGASRFVAAPPKTRITSAFHTHLVIRKAGLLICALFAFAWVTPLAARSIDLEFLQGEVSPQTEDALAGLACRNFDRIVHIDILLNWPEEATEVERFDNERLVFWTKPNDYGFGTEYLFPRGSYAFALGRYRVKGYFIVRAGGIHQGISSVAFEKIDDAAVLLNPAVQETKITSPRCP
jgi:hypothetical protein